jgi:hypothetical protein
MLLHRNGMCLREQGFLPGKGCLSDKKSHWAVEGYDWEEIVHAFDSTLSVENVTDVLGTLHAMAHNVPRLCDVALRPTRPKGHVAEERAVARRSPRRPPRAPMHTTRCYTPLHIKVPFSKVLQSPE